MNLSFDFVTRRIEPSYNRHNEFRFMIRSTDFAVNTYPVLDIAYMIAVLYKSKLTNYVRRKCLFILDGPTNGRIKHKQEGSC